VAGADLDTLQSLVEKSLVRFSEGRYWMLETIREFASERLACAREEELYGSRLLEWSLGLLRSLNPPLGFDPIAFDRIEVDEDNVRAALEYAQQRGRTSEQLQLVPLLAHFWLNRGRLEEGLHWAERVADATREAPLTMDKMLVASCVGEFLRFLRRSREAIPWKQRALEQARELGLAGLAAANLHDLAEIYLELGDLQVARELAHEALAIRERLGTPDEIAHALSTFADIALVEGNLDEALAVCNRLDSLLPYDDNEQRCVLELTLAETYRRCGDERNAAARLRAAAEKTLRVGGSYLVPEVLLVAADLITVRSPTAAAQLMASAQRVWSETGFTVWPVLDYERITAAVEAEQAAELAVDDALLLVLECLD
jgi:tetratricopeptide (TPR) repeat protein